MGSVSMVDVMGEVVSYPGQVFGYIYGEGEVAKATTSGVGLHGYCIIIWSSL